MHQQALQAADADEARGRQHYKEAKARDGELVELSFWKQQHLERFLALERENEGLKAKLRGVEQDAFAGGWPSSSAADHRNHRTKRKDLHDRQLLLSCRSTAGLAI